MLILKLCVFAPVACGDYGTVCTYYILYRNFNFLEKSNNPILVLYCTYFHPRPPFCAPCTFPPFPQPLWGAPDHPERIVVALGSLKANAARVVYAAVYAARAGKPRPPLMVYCQNC